MHAFHRVLSVKLLRHLLAGLLPILLVSPLAAQENDDPEIRRDFVAPKKKSGPQPVPLPAYPDADKLLPVELDVAGSSFSYYIDPDALHIEDQSEVRYTLVAESPSGVRNVFYEGIHCMNIEYISYGYGGGGKLYPTSELRWKLVAESSQRRHYRSLHSSYFCDNLMTPVPVADIIERIKYKQPSGGDLSDD